MQTEFDTLYKPDGKGKTRVWEVRAVGDEVLVTHGLQDGKLQTKTTKVEGKNLGKANETTPEAQAAKVALSKWTAQKDRKGYALSPEEAVLARLPMLAYDYNKHGHRINYPAGVQPKLDGIRCLATKHAEGDVRLTSRTGKSFGADLSHIENMLDVLLSPGISLDGELYCHDKGLELEDISSAVQKTGDNTPLIEFWVFDVADSDRFYDNSRRAGTLQMGFEPRGPLKLVKTELVHSEDEMKAKHDLYVSAGFEGCMVRNRDGIYKFNRRSADLQKFKRMLDREYRVLDIEEDVDGNPVFVCASGNSVFRTTINGSRTNTKRYLDDKDKWKGKWLKVQYQKIYRDSGLPQFPRGLVFRDCDDKGDPLY